MFRYGNLLRLYKVGTLSLRITYLSTTT